MKKTKKKNKKAVKFNFKNLFKVEPTVNKRTIVLAFVIGLALGLLIMTIFIPERIAKLENGEEVIVTIKDKNITANQYYENLKSESSLDLLLDIVDDMILSEMYPEDNEMKTSVNNMADYYISMYETYYGYTEEKFLEANNFESKEDFLKTLTLEYRRNEYLSKYLKELISDSEIEKYYNDKIFGDVEVKYILVDSTKENSKELAKKVIDRLNNNESFEDIVKHYGDRITSKDLGYVSYNNDLSEAFVKTLNKLEDGKYTKEALEENGKYYVILRGSSKDKKSYEDMKEEIQKTLIETKKQENPNLYYQALNKLRMANDVSFKDTNLNKRYEEYTRLYEN